MSDTDPYREQLGLATEKKPPGLFEQPQPPKPIIPISPQPVDPFREQLDLETSPLYDRRKGAIPETDDPALSLMRLLAASEDPVAEITRLNATQYIAKTFNLDPAQTYGNLEELSQYWLGKIVPAPVFAQSLRDAWDNGMKNYDLSKLALKLREKGGEDPLLIQQITELEESMVPLSDIPRPWIKNALLVVAESLPLTAQSFLRGGIMGGATGAAAGLMLGAVGAVPTAGLSIPAMTLAMASVGFAVGSTQDMIQSMRGLAYWRMVKANVPHNVAGPLSDIEGVIEGAIESLGQVFLGVKLPVLTPALKSLGTIIANKMMAMGVVSAIGTRIASQIVGAGLGEGIENPLQEATAIFTDMWARELAKRQDIVTDLAPITPEEAAKRIGESFYQGMSAGLIFGVVGIPAGIRADVRQLNTIRALAERMPTRLGFINSVIRGDFVLQETGVSETRWREYLGKVWDKQHPGKAPAVPIVSPAAPGVTAPAAAAAAAPARGPEGRVYTQVETRTRTREGTTAVLKAGDPATGARFGYVSYETVGERIYVEDVVNETETDIRRELLLDLAARYPGQEIEWNPTDELDIALKEDLVATNPRGPEAGLQWFEPQVQPVAAQKELTRQFFVQRMGELFNAATPEQAEVFGKLADTFAQVAGQATEDWLRQYIAPEVAVATPEAAAALKEKAGVAATRFRVGEQVVAPLSVDEFKGEVRALFTALGKADFHHGVHEFFHAVERLALSPEQVRKFETALGKLRPAWTEADVETLADRFEDYLATGKAPTPELQTVFQQIAAALKALISFIRERLAGEPTLLSPEFQAAYDALFRKPESGLAQAREIPVKPFYVGAEAAPKVEEGVPPAVDNGVTIISPSAVPPVEIELTRISISEEVPNFKELADRRGIIEPLQAEEYIRVGIPPIVLWERLDGRLEVITGRHRLDLAQRLKLPTILSQIVREADGFTAAQAMTFDAESNIRDGQGSVRDYANYFRNSEITEGEASRRGLLDRHKGRTGFAIGRYASDGLYSLYRNAQISEAKAAAIAAASLGDERLQSLGITKSKKLTADELGNFIALARQTVTTPAGVQADMFGYDDSLILEGEQVAKAVSAKKAELLQERQALSSALRLSKGAQAKIVEKYGFKVGDTAAIQDRVDQLGEELASWENWTQDPVKMREARTLAGLPVSEALLHPEEGEPPEPPPFELVPFSDKLIRPKPEKVVQPVFDFAKKTDVEIKDELDNLTLFHRDEALQKEFNKAAIKIFGVTEDPRMGAWILSNGKMLDFSIDRHKRPESYHGRLYHNEIKQALAELKEVTEQGAYSNAWRAGTLRMDATMGFVSIQSTMIPTPEQMQTIESALPNAISATLEIVGTDIDERTLAWQEIADPEIKDVRRFYAKAARELGMEQALFHPESPEFKEWFGDSKVVDENGKPLRVYHGTTEVFRAFSMTKTGLRTGNRYGTGAMFFTDDPISAGAYATIGTHPLDRPNIIPAYLSLQNPAIIDAHGSGWMAIREDILTAQKAGRDGAIIRNVLDYADAITALEQGPISVYIAFRPEQIKSVFNRDIWSITETDLLMHPEDWQGELLYGTSIDSDIYQQQVELAKGYDSAEAFRTDMETKYGEPGEADIAGETAKQFYEEVWNEAHKPAPEEVVIPAPVLETTAQFDVEDFNRIVQMLDDVLLKADVTTGNVTEEKIEKISTQAEAEEKKAIKAGLKEEAKTAANKRRAAKKLRDVRRKLIHDIMRPPGRSIQFRGYAEQIRIIQEGLSGTTREYRVKGGVRTEERTMKGYAREQTRRFFEENPEAAALVPREKLERFYTVNLQDMTLADLEEIDATLTQLRKLGTLKRHLELVQKARHLAIVKNQLAAAVLRGKPPEKPVGGVKPTGLLMKGMVATWKPNRVLALLDGVFAGQEKSPFTQLGQTQVNEDWNGYKKAVRERMQKVYKKAEELKFTFDRVSLKKLKGYEWVGRGFDIDGFRYSNGKIPTLQDVMYWYIGLQNERNALALQEGNNLPMQLMLKGIGMLSEKERALAEAIAEDFESNFPRLRDAFIDTFNMDLPGENNYVPMRRKEISYETRLEEVAAELTGRAGVRKQFIARHPTYERIDIANEHQKPVRTDLINLWVEGVKVQEGFIYQDATIKEMHAALESDQVRAAVTQKYGPELNKWISKYINDLAQAEAYTSLKGLERLSRLGRAHATVAWLGFNLLSIAKQSVGTLGYLADLGPLGPAYILSATAQFAAGQVKAAVGGHFLGNTLVDFVRERSELIRNRQISEELENLKRTNVGIYNNIIGKIGKWGMKGLEAMDTTTVCIGWKAVYDKILRETDGDEVKAIAAADEATLRSQPSARVQDMAEIYRMGELAKWFTMFTSELNAIWNRLSFDVPLALRRKQFFQAIADVTSIAMAGMVIAIASGALQGDDEEKKKKMLLLGLTDEFFESIPIFGNDIFSVISGRRFQSGGVKLVPAVSMAMETFKQVTEGDWDSALKNILETLSFTTGLPYAQPRRIIKTIRTGDVRALLGWPAGEQK